MSEHVDAFDAAVGRRVRIARMDAGLSLSDLAASLGVTYQQVQKNEKGVNRIGASRLRRIAEATGRPVSWFFDEAGRAADSPSDPVEQFAATRQGHRIAKAFASIPDDARDIVGALVEKMARIAQRES